MKLNGYLIYTKNAKLKEIKLKNSESKFTLNKYK